MNHRKEIAVVICNYNKKDYVKKHGIPGKAKCR